jgi:hypothetical protein
MRSFAEGEDNKNIRAADRPPGDTGVCSCVIDYHLFYGAKRGT